MMINLKESTVYFSHVCLNDFYLGHETIFIVHKQIIKPSTRGRPDKDFILQMYQRPHQKHSNRFIKWFHDFSVKIFSRQYLRSIVWTRPQSLWLVTQQSKPPRRKSLAEYRQRRPGCLRWTSDISSVFVSDVWVVRLRLGGLLLDPPVSSEQRRVGAAECRWVDLTQLLAALQCFDLATHAPRKAAAAAAEKPAVPEWRRVQCWIVCREGHKYRDQPDYQPTLGCTTNTYITTLPRTPVRPRRAPSPRHLNITHHWRSVVWPTELYCWGRSSRHQGRPYSTTWGAWRIFRWQYLVFLQWHVSALVIIIKILLGIRGKILKIISEKYILLGDLIKYSM